MTTRQSSEDWTGADLVGFEAEQDLKARLVALLGARHASLELELTNLAARICDEVDVRLVDINRRTSR